MPIICGASLNEAVLFSCYRNAREDVPVLKTFWADQSGATSIEYCLIAGLISILIVTGATKIGTNLYNRFYGPLGGALN